MYSLKVKGNHFQWRREGGKKPNNVKLRKKIIQIFLFAIYVVSNCYLHIK